MDPTRARNNDLCLACGGWVSTHQAYRDHDGTHHHPHLDCTMKPIVEHPLSVARDVLGTASRPLLDQVLRPVITSVIQATRHGAMVLLEQVTTRYASGEQTVHWEVVTLGRGTTIHTDPARAREAFFRWPHTERNRP